MAIKLNKREARRAEMEDIQHRVITVCVRNANILVNNNVAVFISLYTFNCSFNQPHNYIIFHLNVCVCKLISFLPNPIGNVHKYKPDLVEMCLQLQRDLRRVFAGRMK